MRTKRYFETFDELKAHLMKRIGEDLPVAPSAITSHTIAFLAKNNVTHKAQLYAMSRENWRWAFARNYDARSAERMARALNTLTFQEGVPLGSIVYTSPMEIVAHTGTKDRNRESDELKFNSHFYINWEARPFEEILPYISQRHIHTDLMDAPVPTRALTSLAKSLTDWVGGEPKRRIEFMGLSEAHVLSVLGPDVQDQIREVLSSAIRHKRARDLTPE